MTKEQLTQVNVLVKNIELKKVAIENIKKDINSLDQYSYDEITIKTSEFSYFTSYGGYQEKNTISLSVSKSEIKRLLNKKLYIQENLLKKHELEFSKL